MAHHIRNHWQVENCLHLALDVTFRQDGCRIRTGNAAANFATINQAAMNLSRRAPGKISLPQNAGHRHGTTTTWKPPSGNNHSVGSPANRGRK